MPAPVASGPKGVINMQYHPRGVATTFRSQYLKSNKHNEEIKRVLISEFPGGVPELGSVEDDKAGTDWWVVYPGKKVSIDCKIREKDFGKDDIALEIWGDIKEGRIGWTLDVSKRTDYVLIYWADTRKFLFLPFCQLLKAFTDNKDAWIAKYKPKTQDSKSWQSQAVFIPRTVLLEAMFEPKTLKREFKCFGFGGNMDILFGDLPPEKPRSGEKAFDEIFGFKDSGDRGCMM